MRVTLLHKPSAGEGAHNRDELVALFAAHGHTVTYCSVGDDGWPDALRAPADCVVAAGGDGTVGRVARRLLGQEVPLAILPLGTANNIALRLGLSGPPEALVPRLAAAEPQPFDVGVASGPWGTRWFLESVGLGAFTQAMAFVKTEAGALIPAPPARSDALARDLRLLRAVLRDLDAHRSTLWLDGEPEEVVHLLVEVSNTGLLGPNVPVAPDAEYSDGRFDVVVAREAERERLERYLSARLAGENAPPPSLPTRRSRSVRLTVDGVRVHIDGDVWPDEDEPPPDVGAPFEVELRLIPSALQFLVPA